MFQLETDIGPEENKMFQAKRVIKREFFLFKNTNCFDVFNSNALFLHYGQENKDRNYYDKQTKFQCYISTLN